MKFINLHSSDPGVEGSQAGGYESYAAFPMDSVRWKAGRNVDHISFPEATGGVVTLSYVAVTDDDGRVLSAGPLIRPLYVETGITPQIPAGALVFNEDDGMCSTEPPAISGDKTEFRNALERTINCHSMENGSNTPDFVLAQYLADCLAAFDKAMQHREAWYGRGEGDYPPDTAEQE